MAVRWEERFRQAASAAFDADRKKLLVIISATRAKALARKAMPDWEEAEYQFRSYLGNEGAENWRSQFNPVLRGLINAQGEQLNAAFGFRFDVRNLFAEEWYERYILQFAQPINATTSDSVSEVLRQGMREGWSVPETQRNLDVVFRQWMTGDLSADDFRWLEQRLPPHRTEMIARTETIRASNQGSQALYRDWGIKRKEWLTAIDNLTCDFCPPMNRQEVGIDALFSGGLGQIDAPPYHVSCRCTVLPVVRS